MYEDYFKKLKELGEDVPKICKKIAKKGAIHFANEAKRITDNEGLVDTGNYKRNWSAEEKEPVKNTYAIDCENSVDYASYLEYGTGRGIKGRFVGRQAMGDLEWYCLEQFEKEWEKAFKKHHQSFTKSP